MRRDVLAALLLPLLAAAVPQAALRAARVVLLDFGPNDQEYVRGFRQDWERDGRTRFHWTSQAANVRLPLRVGGEGPILRLRYRRHFVEPASVRLTLEGRSVGAFVAQAEPQTPYRVFETALPELLGLQPFVLSIEAPSVIDRPLGIALDWMELELRPGTRLSLLPGVLLRFALAALAAFVLPRLAGAPFVLALLHALGLIALGGWGAASDVLAFERIVREGLPAFLVVSVVALSAVLVFSRSQEYLTIAARSAVTGSLVALVQIAMAARLALLLHPQFFYPDVRVHASFALLLARRGFAELGSGIIENQFRLGLGLQQVGDHWYAFPYPPGFYVLAAPLIALFGYRPEVAVSLLAAAVNSLEVLLVFVIARNLGAGILAAVLSSALVPLLPLFLTRLSLGYFPALVGHAFDALAIAWLLARRRSLATPGSWLVLCGLLTLAFLAYTQSGLNVFLTFGLFVLLDVGVSRSREAWRRALAIAGAFLVAGLAAFGLFYFRYVPMLEAMRDGRAPVEERIVIERFEREERARLATGERPAVEEPDPYTGPTFDPLRGVRKAGWRLFVFYGPFAALVALGFCALASTRTDDLAHFTWVWGGSYLLLNVLSGSLPGPNLVRYNKDLEWVAPLACASLGFALAWLWERPSRPWRAVALLLGAAWLWFSVARGVAALVAGFALER